MIQELQAGWAIYKCGRLRQLIRAAEDYRPQDYATCARLLGHQLDVLYHLVSCQLGRHAPINTDPLELAGKWRRVIQRGLKDCCAAVGHCHGHGGQIVEASMSQKSHWW